MNNIKKYHILLVKKGRLLKVVRVDGEQFFIFRVKDNRIPGAMT